MTRFSRRAGWLTQLFTPSVVPTTRFPDRVSEDVSLVAPYDGGGWGIPDPSEFMTRVLSATIAAGNTTLRTNLDTDIMRILAISASLAAGAPPAVTAQVLVPGAGFSCVISDNLVINANAQVLPGLRCPIVCPTGVLEVRHTGGDAATIVEYILYAATLPLGVSPTI